MTWPRRSKYGNKAQRLLGSLCFVSAFALMVWLTWGHSFCAVVVGFMAGCEFARSER